MTRLEAIPQTNFKDPSVYQRSDITQMSVHIVERM
ncbi:hypothetical protein AVEN_74055-1, partial [Araneus ventricosus]